jgi:hypothetical protein
MHVQTVVDGQTDIGRDEGHIKAEERRARVQRETQR